ncbi:MAG: TonB-dependent receptor [Halieaceae bacterium]|jgi:iron complex outermembrane recepter protein|nr:TonB-dependent receptor [Halieaceae bacterium]
MYKKMALKLGISAALGTTIGLTGPAAIGQELEEVLVTARKRQENLQQVPIAISAFSAKDIEEAGLMRLQEISSLVPNMTYLEANTNKFTNFTLRGISSGGGLGNDPAIGVYIDEVYIGRDSGFNGDLLDIERVEVLKGPQGTLFGRNTAVGAISITTKKPGDELEGKLLVDVGDYDYARVGALISVPFSDNVAGKISIVKAERDGYLDNTFGGTVNTVDYTTTRAQLRWNASDNLEFLFTGNYRKDEADGNNYVTRQVGEPIDKSYTVSIPDVGYEDVKDTSFSLRVTYDTDNYTVTSITAMQDLEEDYVNDNDWSPLDDLTTVDTRDMESWSQELRIASAGESSIEWVAGLYFYHQEFDVFTQAQNGYDTIYGFFGLSHLVGSGIPPSQIVAAFPDGLAIGATSTIETDSFAAFFSATYAFNEQWSMTVGARYSEDEKDLDMVQEADPFAAVAGFLPFTLEDEQDDSEVTPAASINWQPNDDILVYARYSSGYKAGGFNNTISNDAAVVPFDAETLDAYELGLKSTFLDNTLRINAAIFHMEYKDKQESTFVAAAGFQTGNAGEATSEGFEVDVEWIPADRWTVFGAVGYADAEYDEYVVDEFQDNSGNTLTRAPQWNASIGVHTDWDFTSSLRGNFRVDYSYQDEFFTQSNNNPFFVGDSQSLMNARLGIASSDNSWAVTLWGRNLTDEDNVNNLFGASSFAFPLYHYALIAPRTYGVELQYNF